MFTLTKIETGSAFIRRNQVGFITHQPEVRLCMIEFDSDQYSDTLFEKNQLSIPDSIQHAVVKRKAEYLASRFAAQALFKAENVTAQVMNGQDAAPRWPKGWTGSISHTDQCAVVIIAPEPDQGLGLGIDIEKQQPDVLIQTAGLYTHADERKLLAASGLDYATALLIVFSVKESLFKALYPLTKTKFGFDAAKITALNLKSCCLTLKPTKTLSQQLAAQSQLTGYFHIQGANVVTYLSVELTKPPNPF